MTYCSPECLAVQKRDKERGRREGERIQNEREREQEGGGRI